MPMRVMTAMAIASKTLTAMVYAMSSKSKVAKMLQLATTMLMQRTKMALAHLRMPDTIVTVTAWLMKTEMAFAIRLK
jgi:hypothetical protein